MHSTACVWWRVGDILFLYYLEFVPGWNPEDACDHFSEALRSYFVSRGLEFGMSALGGMVRSKLSRQSDGRLRVFFSASLILRPSRTPLEAGN